MLNPQPIEVADEILDSPHRCVPKVYYLDGAGKNFTYNYLAAAIRAQGCKFATAAWTRIAATLLSGGRTVHSLFKLPVPLLDILHHISIIKLCSKAKRSVSIHN